MYRRSENWHFSFLAAPAGHAPLQADLAQDTGQVIGAHTSASRQCADETKAGVGADRPARIHTGRSGGLWRSKGMDGAGRVKNKVPVLLL